MKATPPAAKPYARALHDLARERNETEAVGRELDAVADAVRGDAETRAFFTSPSVNAQVKGNVAAEIGRRLGVSKLVGDFLTLVAAKGRAEYLEAIADEFRALVDVDLNRVRASVRTAAALSDAESTALAEKLGRALGGKHVLIEESVDPELLGGFVAEIGSYIVDGSLDGQLARLRDRLVQA